MKLFAMEKELRIIKNRGHFPVPVITPQGTKIETSQDKIESFRGSRHRSSGNDKGCQRK